jgi:flagellar biosynthesis protein FlhG
MTSSYRLTGATGNSESKTLNPRLAGSKGPSLSIEGRGPKIIAVTSGKGGVGKTNVVANLSACLSELGKKVVVLDADFGLANLDVLLGLTPRYNLGHVLLGNKSLSEIMVPGPRGIRVIPASSGLQSVSELTLAQRNHLIDSFADLDSDTDYFIIDTAAGISHNVTHFLLSAQEVVVVIAPEPTAIIDAYAIIKIILREDRTKNIQVLVNWVDRAEDAQEVFCQVNSVAKRFLKREVGYLGYIERDFHIPKAVRSQVLVTHSFPDAPASRNFRDLARRMVQQGGAVPSIDGYKWEKLLNDWVH